MSTFFQYMIPSAIMAVAVLISTLFGPWWWVVVVPVVLGIYFAVTSDANLKPGVKTWFKESKLFCAAIVLVVAAVAAFAFGWKLLGWLLVIAGIICFIVHSCRWGKWCRRNSAWWRRGGKKKMQEGLRKAWITTRVVIRRGIVPFFIGMARSMRPWVESNIWLLLSIGFGLWAYHLHRDSRGWEQSRWFWALAGLSLISLLLYSSFIRRYVGGFLGWLLMLPVRGITHVWEEFQGKASKTEKALLWGIAVFGFAIVSSLVMEVYQRNSGWLFKVLRINMMWFDRVTWPGALFVAGVFTLAFLVLLATGAYFGTAKKGEKKKPSKEEDKIKARREKAELDAKVKEFREMELLKKKKKA